MKKKQSMERGNVGLRFPVSPTLLVAVESILLTFVLEILSRQSVVSAFRFLIERPHLYLFNALMVSVTLAFAMLFKKRMLSILVTTILWLVFGIANSIVLIYRTASPLTAVDLQLGVEALQMVHIYFKVWQIALVILAVLALVVLIVLVAVKSPKYRKAGMSGIIRFFAFLLAFLACMLVLFSNPKVISTELRPSLYDSYLKYGFPYCFTYSFFDIGISEPDGYSDVEVDKIVQESDLNGEATEEEPTPVETVPYAGMTESDRTGSFESKPDSYTVEAVEAIRERLEESDQADYEKRPNIIFVQLESFFDPTIIRELTFSGDPIPNFRKLKETGTSGTLYVPTVAGGTANTEFEVLTGCSLDYFGAGEYPYYSILREKTCESLAIDLRALDYHATAIHNYSGSFYYRNTVYDHLGFNNFISREYMEGFDVTPMGWPKDAILQKRIRDTLNSTEGRDFVFCVTVQTHGKYIELPETMEPVITVEGYEDESSKRIMEYFLVQLYEADQLIGSLVEEYSQYDEDVMIVFYGDHLPGMNLTNDILTTGNIYATEYVIWSNFETEKADRDLEAYQLGAYALGHVGIDTGTMVRFHQTQMEKESYEYNLEILEYDMLYGKKIVYDGRELRETCNLVMGLEPIRVTGAYVKNGNLFVEGEYFTSASAVFLDGDESGDTIFVNESLLVVPDKAPEDHTLLTVAQISADGIALSFSEAYECMGLRPKSYN